MLYVEQWCYVYRGLALLFVHNITFYTSWSFWMFFKENLMYNMFLETIRAWVMWARPLLPNLKLCKDLPALQTGAASPGGPPDYAPTVSLLKQYRQEAKLDELILLNCNVTLTDPCKSGSTFLFLYLYRPKKLWNVLFETFATSTFLLRTNLPLVWPFFWLSLFHPSPKIIPSYHFIISVWGSATSFRTKDIKSLQPWCSNTQRHFDLF